jgi:hypothetical protein
MTYVGWVKHDCYIICTLIVKIVGHQLIQHETWIHRCVYILKPPKHQALGLDPPYEDVIFHGHTSGWNLLGCSFQILAMTVLFACLSPNKHISWKDHVHLHVKVSLLSPIFLAISFVIFTFAAFSPFLVAKLYFWF